MCADARRSASHRGPHAPARDPAARPRAVEPADARGSWDAVDASRAHLEPWLPWVPFNTDLDASHRYADASAIDWDHARAPAASDASASKRGGARGSSASSASRRWRTSTRARSSATGSARRHGRGYMTEAARATVAWAFQRVNAHRVRVAAATDNYASLGGHPPPGLPLRGDRARGRALPGPLARPCALRAPVERRGGAGLTPPLAFAPLSRAMATCRPGHRVICAGYRVIRAGCHGIPHDGRAVLGEYRSISRDGRDVLGEYRSISRDGRDVFAEYRAISRDGRDVFAQYRSISTMVAVSAREAAPSSPDVAPFAPDAAPLERRIAALQRDAAPFQPKTATLQRDVAPFQRDVAPSAPDVAPPAPDVSPDASFRSPDEREGEPSSRGRARLTRG